MDILRHTGRAELASFLGGSNAEADASQWGFAPYTEADLQKQLEQAPADLRGGRPAGGRRRPELRRRDQRICRRSPRESAPETGRVRPDRQADRKLEIDRHHRDRLADRRHLRPRRGQRAQLGPDHAGLRSRFGRKAGRKAWLGFRSKNDPEAPTTLSKKFPYDRRRLRQQGSRAPRQEQRPSDRVASSSSAPRLVARAVSATHRALAARSRARLQLGDGVGEALGDGPPDRGARARRSATTSPRS